MGVHSGPRRKSRCDKYRNEEDINSNNLHDVFLYGGLGYGKVCVPKMLSDLLIIIMCPPLYVFLYQRERKFNDITQILVNIVLTSCLYFPGVIHALHIKSNRCGSLFRKRSINDKSGNQENKYLQARGSDTWK